VEGGPLPFNRAERMLASVKGLSRQQADAFSAHWF
jgi:hypothetical protein